MSHRRRAVRAGRMTALIFSAFLLCAGCGAQPQREMLSRGGQSAEQAGAAAPSQTQPLPGQSTQSIKEAPMLTEMTAEYRKIDPAEAKRILDSDQSYTLLDVRTQAEYDMGHIPGAILLLDNQVDSVPEKYPDKTALYLIYCRSGRRSGIAARQMVEWGYVNVYDFGGIIDWPYDTEP